MSGVVLDASALLAMLLDEAGGDRVAASLDDAIIGSVNYAEVVSHYAKLGAKRHDIEQMLNPLPIRIVDPDPPLAMDSGMLRYQTRTAGLSLGDRFCLALAKREERPVLTADRPWEAFAKPLGIAIVLIR